MNTYDITGQVRGDTFAGIRFELKEKTAPEAEATPINLTGCEIKMQVRREYDDSDLILDLSTTNEKIEITGTDHNIIDVKSALIPANAPARKCVYDVQIKFTTDEVKTYIRGCFEILKDVSR